MMEVLKTKSDGGPKVPTPASTGTEAAGIVSEPDRYQSYDFVGCDPEGRYVFRPKGDPLRTFVGDREDYLRWKKAQVCPPVIDADACNQRVRYVGGSRIVISGGI